MEGTTEDKSDVERRIERIEETKKILRRTLKKDEKMVLDIINKQKSLFFEELLELTSKKRTELENILEVLSMRAIIKIRRELLDSSWTKHISSIKDYSNDIKVKKVMVNKKEKGFIWNLFSRQPCLICPFIDKCNDTNSDNFNPKYCSWLTDWINSSLKNEAYNINFDEIEDRFKV